jgi:hypothetical protein
VTLQTAEYVMASPLEGTRRCEVRAVEYLLPAPAVGLHAGQECLHAGVIPLPGCAGPQSVVLDQGLTQIGFEGRGVLVIPFLFERS